MALSSLASAEGEPLVLTIDGSELVAHDAATMTLKWTVEFERSLVGVVYAAPEALPGDARVSPWRSSASSTVAIAVDDGGTLHVVDSATGRVLSTLGPFGAPAALTAGGTSIALAAGNLVRLWHEGVLSELTFDATALAFGHGQLAIGEAGKLHRYDLAKRAVVLTEATEGRVAALASHWVAGSWLVGVEEGLFSGKRRLASGDVRGIAMDARQRRVVVQRTNTHVAVFRGSFDVPELRVKYTNRSVSGLALVGSRVLIALDRGDANAIEVETKQVTRTSRAPERTWTPELGPDPLPAGPVRSSSTGSSGTLLVISMAGAGLIALVMWLIRTLGDSSVPGPTCDLNCEVNHLRAVSQRCEAKACTDEAEKAITALEDGRCIEVRASLGVLRATAEPGTPLMAAIDEALAGLVSVWPTACTPKR